MKYATFDNNIINYVSGNTIAYNGKIVISPSIEIMAKVGIYPVEDISEDGTDELVNGVIKHYIGGRSLTLAKSEMITRIEEYDTSSNVNSFIYNGNEMWLDKATRVGVVNAINAAISLNKSEITIGIGNYSVTLSPTDALNMFNQLEMYALECYNVTLKHKNNVQSLETIEEVDNYTYNSGYPDKLSFNL